MFRRRPRALPLLTRGLLIRVGQDDPRNYTKWHEPKEALSIFRKSVSLESLPQGVPVDREH